MEEIELIQRAQKGNRSAMNSLIMMHYPMLKGYAFKLTGTVDDASELVNDTIVKTISNITKFKFKSKFSTWMLTICTNIYKDQLKKNTKEILSDEIEVTSERSPEAIVMDSIQMEQVFDLLEELPKQQRIAFVLKHYHECSYEEIAEIMKCPVGTVRSRLHNGINTLKNRLERRNSI